MIFVLITTGPNAGRSFEFDADRVRIGRSPTNDLVMEDAQVSAEHAEIVVLGDEVYLCDRGSTNGTALRRRGERVVVPKGGDGVSLHSGDVIELGRAEAVTELEVTLIDDDDAQVMSVRRLEELVPAAAKIERDPNILSSLYAAQKRIGAATDLDSVLIEVADCALDLLPKATHVTVILRDDDRPEEPARAAWIPVMTRVRLAGGRLGAPRGPVPVSRSVYRRVIRERAAVLAADASAEADSTESLMGASIRSTVGVPLWRGEDILGVLQVDNRSMPAMLSAADVETLLILASNASLAVANARLIKRLVAAEERLNKENLYLKGREERRRGGGPEGTTIIGESAPMRRLLSHVDKVAATRATVLIEGETGTGKELVAAAVHYRSPRRNKLFVAQNCAALSESLLESELFGHKKGSFTGAFDDKKGLFEIADGGTLFLDELGEMPIQLQSKLLRALQEGEIRQVGATTSKTVDVRIVAATNRNLEEEVKRGRFREDLYYRLKVFPLHVPPLRERRDDISAIASHFLLRYASEIGKNVGGFSLQTMELLTSYDWPGNVRELQNEVQRLVIQLDPGGFATPELLSPHIRHVEGLIDRANVKKGTLREMMNSVEEYLLIEALRDHDNNKTNAAKTLGITREGLHKKLRNLGI